tara:strand:+ start:927 stop:1406 length:480 start_codon:yes stop_codon:yes gene_type:complete
MWIVAKYKKSELGLFKRELVSRSNNTVEYFQPKLKMKNTKSVSYVLGNYIFCYSEIFSNNAFVENLKNLKGLNYFLDGSFYCQKQINKFVKYCKKNEDEEGFLKNNFFKISLDKNYKFLSGPLKDLIFRFISNNKKKFEINLNGKKVNFDNKNYSFTVV